MAAIVRCRMWGSISYVSHIAGRPITTSSVRKAEGPNVDTVTHTGQVFIVLVTNNNK